MLANWSTLDCEILDKDFYAPGIFDFGTRGVYYHDPPRLLIPTEISFYQGLSERYAANSKDLNGTLGLFLIICGGRPAFERATQARD